MRLTRLVLKDFISYEDLDYMFESKPLLVQGENLTDDGQKTNGVGKSVLPTAIEQCIAGTNSRGVIDSELITYGKQQAVIQLFAECDVRKERIHIENIINLKGSNQFIVKLQQYGSSTWEPANYSTSPEGKKFVSNWFAISKEDLFNYFIINNSRFVSFFDSSNTAKVGLVNRFSDASIVQGIENIDITELEEEQVEKTKTVNGSLGKIELITESISKEIERDFEEELNEESEELQLEIEEIEGQIEELKTVIKNRDSLKPSIKEKVTSLIYEGTINSTKKLEIEKEVETISDSVDISLKKVNEARALVDSFKDIDFKKEKDVFDKQKSEENLKVTKLKGEKELKNQSKKKILTLIEDLSIKLSGTITCPSCSHQFLLDGDLEKLKQKEKVVLGLKTEVEVILEKQDESINEVLGKITKIEEGISSINTRQSKWNDDKNKLVTSLNSSTLSLNTIKSSLSSKELELKTLELKESTRLTSIKTEQEKLTKIDSDNKSTNETIQVKLEKIGMVEEQKKTLEKGSNEEELKKLNENLVLQRKELSKHQIALTEVEEKIANKKQWMLNFKQFRMYLANKSLGVIEYHCNRYLQEMGSDLLIKVEGFKVLADSTIREEITCKIIRNIERNFKSFSGGERGRLLFASILANRFMINETHPYGGLDFLSIDEVFEGVDSEGLLSLVESAKLLAIPVLLITHVSVEEDDNVLTIVKENGVSKIKY
jgi:exonuclease SbcC